MIITIYKILHKESGKFWNTYLQQLDEIGTIFPALPNTYIEDMKQSEFIVCEFKCVLHDTYELEEKLPHQ